jgi:hypothetical protein
MATDTIIEGAGEPSRATQETSGLLPLARAPITLADGRKHQKRLGARAACQLRLVANAQQWGTLPDFDRRSAGQVVPLKIVSDIVVVGQGDQRSTDGEPPPCAEPGNGTFRAGANVGEHLRARTGSFQPEISFEAKRQLVALAEALARQAAREDEEAERLAERSRSPPDAPAEDSTSRSEKEDTSEVARPSGRRDSEPS